MNFLDNHFKTFTLLEQVTSYINLLYLYSCLETAVHWNGYMSGAVEAGERSAEEVKWRLDGVDWMARVKERELRDSTAKSTRSFGYLYILMICVIAILLGLYYRT